MEHLSAVIRPPGPALWALHASRRRLDLNRGAKRLLTVRRNEHDLDHLWGTCRDHKRFESFQPSGQISAKATHPSTSYHRLYAAFAAAESWLNVPVKPRLQDARERAVIIVALKSFSRR